MKEIKIGTSLKEVYESLGDVPVVLTYIEHEEFGDEIRIEALGNEGRKEKLKRALEKGRSYDRRRI